MAAQKTQDFKELQDGIDRMHAINASRSADHANVLNELLTSKLEVEALQKEVEGLKRESRRTRNELVIFKQRPLQIDPLDQPLRRLPLELQEMIQCEVLRLDHVARPQDFRVFFGLAPTVAENVHLPVLLRLRYFPIFLKCNAIDAKAFSDVDFYYREMRGPFRRDFELGKCIRVLQMEVDATFIYNTYLYATSVDVSSELKKCPNLQRVIISLVLSASISLDRRPGASVTLEECGYLQLLREADLPKTIEIRRHARTKKDRHEADSVEKEMWLIEATSTICSVLQEKIPQRTITISALSITVE